MVGKVPLLLGAYQSLSVIAEAQRCVNLFPEKNPQDTETPTTHYMTPGLTSLGLPLTQDRGRMLYCDTQGTLWAIVGNSLYYIDSGWKFNLIGAINAGLNPCYAIDNGQIMVIVDGTNAGYQINLSTKVLSLIYDANFYGADRVDYIDTFFVFNRPGTGQFYSSLSNTVTFDPLYIARKTGTPDNISTLAVIHREIWLLGAQYGSEIWADVGDANFPFAPIPGVFIQYGCAAKYSLAYNGLQLFWLSQDKNGKGFVLMGAPYKAQVISTPAITQELSRYRRLDDAVGYCYQQDGHVFYVLNFPTADKTWVYDESTGQWHERTWTDLNGVAHRDRINFAQFAYGKNVGLDWQTGELYQLDPDNYTHDGLPIYRRRSFPHLVKDGKRMIYNLFSADMEVGTMQTQVSRGGSGGVTAAPK